MRLWKVLPLAFLAALAVGGTVATPRTQIVVGLRQTLFPEKDDLARLSQSGKKDAAKRRAVQNSELAKKANELFEKIDLFKSFSIFLLPVLHGAPEGRSLLEQVRGKTPADTPGPFAQIAVLPLPEWQALKKDFPELEAIVYEKADGRGGALAAVYEPARLKERLAVFDRIDKLTEKYAEDLLTEKLGFHPAETSEVATRLKAQVRQTLSQKSGALKGKDMDREFVRALSDKYVKETLSPELNGRWSGHDPSSTVTSSHKPGERETASGDGGHQKVPTTITPPATK